MIWHKGKRGGGRVDRCGEDMEVCIYKVTEANALLIMRINRL